MININKDATLVGVSELRKGIDKILEKARKGLVIIEKRHKPQAVMMSSEEFDHMQEVVDIAEDIVLGTIAKMRIEGSKDEDFIDIEELMK
ncbi:MAG: type II toxin-antitoxin system Phd/YefM family antitoxin [Candidatus Omnitrophica bacterium]|nr:type II toxin-antitoxin system Phd/YefM family antitoxin [Candidatus Omnitrophota bacterium]MBU1996554.1 type II toxin-antitoxin system Phd/YefM family antitoxin [Candidatus Omnitrophota bacterium]